MEELHAIAFPTQPLGHLFHRARHAWQRGKTQRAQHRLAGDLMGDGKQRGESQRGGLLTRAIRHEDHCQIVGHLLASELRIDICALGSA